MRVLITGVTGFAGGHLAAALLARAEGELFGLSRRGAWPAEWQHLAGRVVLHSCDLCDVEAIVAVLRDTQPERIFHLAGYAHVGQSVREPDAAWSGNLTATRTLYDAVIRWGSRPRILFVGSGQIYGSPDSPDAALHENCVLKPDTPYAASKAAADLLSYQVTEQPGLDVVRARPFNHVGPCQSPRYALASFARQVALIEAGRQPAVLQTGNLSPRRDLSDVRDVVEAYRLLMESGRRGEAYNIGSGVALPIGDVLAKLLALTKVQVQVQQQADLVRAHEPPTLRADAGKLRRETGWQPRFRLEQTLQDMLDYWRKLIG
jgi:GDP-4-dehydro-6-deoxy-D-mannose reductase